MLPYAPLMAGPHSSLSQRLGPASGRHRFAMWSHDAKIIQIGVSPTGGSPGQGKANDPQDRRQDLGPASECTTCNLVRGPHGHRHMGPPMDHTGGVKLGSQKGVILAAQNEPRSGVSSMVYLKAGLEIKSAIPYAIRWECNRDSHVLGPRRSQLSSAW